MGHIAGHQLNTVYCTRSVSTRTLTTRGISSSLMPRSDSSSGSQHCQRTLMQSTNIRAALTLTTRGISSSLMPRSDSSSSTSAVRAALGGSSTFSRRQ